MPKKYTHTAAFAHFGTKPKNVQWSWSARNEQTKVVVVTLWQDEFRRQSGKLIYERSGLRAGEHDNRPGWNELIENLAWAVANTDGRFKVISAIAKDVNADPRSIKECAPTNMTMKILNLDLETGAWKAEALGL